MATAVNHTTTNPPGQAARPHWACHKCGKRAASGVIAVAKSHVLNAQHHNGPTAQWRCWHTTCSPRNLRRGYIWFYVKKVRDYTDIDAFTIELATGPPAAWMRYTDWAEFTARAERQQVAA